jgi:hypothetical protein
MAKGTNATNGEMAAVAIESNLFHRMKFCYPAQATLYCWALP